MAPMKTLGALWSRVLIDPGQCAAYLAIQEYVLVEQDFQIAACSVIFKVQFDRHIRPFISGGWYNPEWPLDNFKL